MTKIMDRVFSAVENKEDTILNQLENDIELAREDGLMDSQQYSIKKLSDNKFELTDKVNNEVTNIESDDNKLALSEPVSETEIQDIPLNSQVAWIDESDNIHQGTLKELNGNLVTIKPMSEDEPEVTLNKDQVRLLDSKTYAAKFKDHKMVIRLGEYDIEFDIDSNIARVLDENVDCSWTFDKGTKMSELIKQAQQEINKCSSKPKAKKFGIKSFNQVNEELGESLDNKLQNFAQDTSFITYTDIMKLKPSKELSKKLHYYLDKYEKGGNDEDAQKVVELVKKGVVKKFSIKQ